MELPHTLVQAAFAAAKALVEPFWLALAFYGLPLAFFGVMLAKIKRYRMWLRKKKGYMHRLDWLPGVNMRSPRNLQVATGVYLGITSLLCLYLFLSNYHYSEINRWHFVKATLGIVLLWGYYIENWNIRIRFRSRSPFDGIDTIEEFLELHPTSFEHLVAGVFRKMGYRAEVTGGSGDKGVDIKLTRWFKPGIVSCKRYKGIIPPEKIRDLLGTMVDFNVNEAFLVTSGRFSRESKEYAAKHGIRLIDGEELSRLL